MFSILNTLVITNTEPPENIDPSWSQFFNFGQSAHICLHWGRGLGETAQGGLLNVLGPARTGPGSWGGAAAAVTQDGAARSAGEATAAAATAGAARGFVPQTSACGVSLSEPPVAAVSATAGAAVAGGPGAVAGWAGASSSEEKG